MPLSRPKRTYSAKNRAKAPSKPPPKPPPKPASKPPAKLATTEAEQGGGSNARSSKSKRRQRDASAPPDHSPSSDDDNAANDYEDGEPLVIDGSADPLKVLLAKLHKQASKERARRRQQKRSAFDAEVDRLAADIAAQIDDGADARAEMHKDAQSAVHRFVDAVNRRGEIEQKIGRELATMAALYEQGLNELKAALQGRVHELEFMTEETIEVA